MNTTLEIAITRVQKLLFIIFVTIFISRFFLYSDYTPDSFAYIEGAKNILLSGEFKYDANQQSITVFAPLYSIILAAGMSILGVNMKAVIFINFVLFSTTILLIYNNIIKQKPKNESIKWLALSIIFTYPYFQNTLSECLAIPLFIALYFTINSTHKNKLTKIYFSILLCILLILTKYSSIIIIAALYFTLNLRSVILGKQLHLTNILPPLVSITVLIVLRHWNSMRNGIAVHKFQWGSGKYNLLEYCSQFLSGLTESFLGHHKLIRYAGAALNFQIEPTWWFSIILLTFFFIIYKINIDVKNITFIIIAFALHLFIFLNTHIEDPFGHRFIYWIIFILLVSFRHISSITHRILLLSFLHVINISYFSLKGYKYLNENNCVRHLYITDYFFTGNYKSNITKEPRYVIKKTKRYIESPCYSWEITNY